MQTKTFLLILLFCVGTMPLKADLGPIRFAGDANAIIQPEAVITVSGNYRLARTINPTVNGITIAVDDVVLDLNGYEIDGSGAASVGINVASTRNNITIKNGLVRNCNTGIIIGTLVSTSTNIKIENVTTSDNSLSGLDIINVRNVQCNNCKAYFNQAGIHFNRVTDGLIANSECNSNITGISIQSNGQSGKTIVENCQCNTNSSIGILIDSIQSVNVVNCQASANGSQGFQALSSNQIQFRNCAATQNGSSGLPGDGFLAAFCVDVLYDSCISMSNLALTNIASGFRTLSDIKTMYRSCIATDNVGSITGVGFNLINETNSCVINCVAKRNHGTNGAGIYLQNSIDCVVHDNLVVENFGTTTSFGIAVVVGASLTTSVLGNRAQNHGVNNYVINPGTIPAVRYTINPFFISSAPTPVDNIDIR